MKTIIIAGGFSTRLYPLTEFFPKSLLKIKDQEIIRTLIEDLLKATNDEIVCVSNNRYFKTFETWFKKNYPSIKIINNQVNDPTSRLGAIGDILFALEKTKWTDDLLVLSSDTLTSLKLKDLVDFYQIKKGVVNAIFDKQDKTLVANKLGCVELDQESKIIGFEEKPEVPKTTLTSIPYYIFPKETIPLIKEYKQSGESLDAPGSLIHWLIKKFPVYGYLVKGYYEDVGTHETLKRLSASKPSL